MEWALVVVKPNQRTKHESKYYSLRGRVSRKDLRMGHKIDAAEHSLRDLFLEVKGFYIPEFQRKYTWKIEDIDRLFETIFSSVKMSADTDYFAFFGAIIAIENPSELSSRYEIRAPEAPDKVYVLIDGQQRVTSFVLLMTEFYKMLKELSAELEKTGPAWQDLQSKLTLIVEDQVKRFFLSSNHTKAKNDLPKIIYQKTADKWKKSNPGVYESIVSKYLFEFNNGIPKITRQEEFLDITERISARLGDFVRDADGAGYFQSVQQILTNGNFASDYLKDLSIDDLISAKATESIGKRIFLALFLIEFITKNVKFVKITVEDENFAFDVFDALNSTGDLLTAIETLRPLMVKHIRNFSTSVEKDWLTDYDEFETSAGREKRHAVSRNFVTSLMLYENALSVSENLNHQRKKLRDYFEQPTTNKSEFIHSISYLTDFYTDLWDKDISGIANIDEQAVLCIDVLEKAKHTLTIPILSRYYTELILTQPDEKKRFSEFTEVIKAVTFFSMVWRLMNGGSTAGIDDIYKKLMVEICRAKAKIFSVKDLKTELKKNFPAKFRSNFSKNLLVNRLSSVQYGNSSSVWLKFFLICAFNDTIVDPKNPGLLIKGAPGANPLLRRDIWKEENALTIEHVAPQTPATTTSWDPLLLNPNYLHAAGNLSILPKAINSVIGNKDWLDKKMLYDIISEKNPKTRIAKLTSSKIKLNAKTENLLTQVSYWYFTASIANAKNWNKDVIQARSENIVNLFWENTHAWLS